MIWKLFLAFEFGVLMGVFVMALMTAASDEGRKNNDDRD